MKHRAFPCGGEQKCPWRRDAEPGQFPAERYEAVVATCRDHRAGHALIGAPVFGCHKGEPGTGDDLACAGFLAIEGRSSVEVRLAVARGRLPVEVLAPGEDWPTLYASYEELAEANGVAR
ncbi:DUF6283 family protein [Spongiactinospora sp. TRM90649]|uniref:DUF6283 family protein n=1 Tax=Spongiactinospora sp. TRM90649 TaxID=3031114 RepID=UPI0023F9E686|nr:DUF6283 family protein [Spongiactinospora sp. TRM90649]MDF5756563.1 DUF6283 family protein [Spongiactinospora sp. TRM90649]